MPGPHPFSPTSFLPHFPLLSPYPTHPSAGGGPSLQALLHILLPGHQDLATVQPLLMLAGGGGGGAVGGPADGVSNGGAGMQLLLQGGVGGGGGTGGPAGGGGTFVLPGGAGSTAFPTHSVVSEAVQPVKEAAVVSGLRVVTAALRMDGAFLATLARAHNHDR